MTSRKYFARAKIATGGSGDIYEVYDRNLQNFAMKLCRKECKISSLAFRRECQMLLEFGGLPHVVPLIEIIAECGERAIILPLMHQSLHDELNEQKGKRFCEKDAATIFHQVCIGIKQFHDRKFAHLDIKPHNILKDATGKYYICDLGSVGQVYTGNEFTTEEYSAPEIVKSIPHNYPLPADIWSLGILLCNLLVGHVVDVRNELSALQLFSFLQPLVSFLALELIEGMLQVNPVDRLTIDEVLDHPWLRMNATGKRKPTQSRIKLHHSSNAI